MVILITSCNPSGSSEDQSPYASSDSVSQQIKELINTVNSLRYTNPDSAFKLLDKTETLSKGLIASTDGEEQEKGYRYLAESFNFRGVTKSNIGRYDEALQLHSNALDIYQKIGDKRGIGDTYTDMAYAFRLNGQYTEALDYNLKNMEICKETGFLHGLGQAYGNIGIIYFFQEDYIKALEYYNKHYEVGKQNKNGYEQLIALNNIGEVYDKLGEYEKSISYYKDAVHIADSLGSLYQAAYILGNIGLAEQNLSHHERASEYYERSLSIREKINDKEGIAIMLNSMASLYFIQHEYIKSINLSKRSLSIAEEYHIPVEIKKACENLYMAYDKLNNFEKAYLYHKQFKAWSDSVFGNALNNEIAEIEIKYQTREKEQQITLLTEKEKIRKLELKRTRLVGIFLSITALLVVLVAISIYRRYKFKTRMNNELEILNARLSESEKHLKQLNATKDRFFSILAHDLKSPLVSFRTITTSLSENIDQLPPEKLNHFIEKLKKTSGTVVDLFNNLLSWSLSQTNRIDFSPSEINLSQITGNILDLYASEISKKQLVIGNNVSENLKAFADSNMTATVIRNLFSNAIKFSPEKGTIKLDVDKTGDKIKFQITDMGPGLTTEDQAKLFRIDVKNREIGSGENKGTGLGLILCKEFINKNGGEIGIESESGKGCTFWFTLKNLCV
ncbi:MAG: tetratricopeptide repeat-containing sensor histidine kinase [Prolixibacteraceae bacterium]|nr:tetratricopeptide repeat-containing sensor histidine kinase [Prolixibacteraceae bacterium]